MKMSDVKFAIPKGSLEDATFKLLEKSWTKVNRKSRTYIFEILKLNVGFIHTCLS